jgi:alcohol dehydrogenase
MLGERKIQTAQQVNHHAAIEAVGIPESFDICQAIVAAGGHIANVGVHGKPVQLNLDKLWSHNITLTTRLVDTVTTRMLLKTVISGKIAPKQLITHHFSLNDILTAYDTFGDAMKERALKVIITNDNDLSEPHNMTVQEAVQAWQNEGDPN